MVKENVEARKEIRQGKAARCWRYEELGWDTTVVLLP